MDFLSIYDIHKYAQKQIDFCTFFGFISTQWK